MKYPMKSKTEKPLFNYMVRFNSSLNYYLFKTPDEALKCARKLGAGNKACLVYEIYLDTKTKEYKGRNTFRVLLGKVYYDEYARFDLHIQFYVSVGEWLNPNEKWLDILNKRYSISEFTKEIVYRFSILSDHDKKSVLRKHSQINYSINEDISVLIDELQENELECEFLKSIKEISQGIWK